MAEASKRAISADVNVRLIKDLFPPAAVLYSRVNQTNAIAQKIKKIINDLCNPFSLSFNESKYTSCVLDILLLLVIKISRSNGSARNRTEIPRFKVLSDNQLHYSACLCW